jgi:hypothetical protein
MVPIILAALAPLLQQLAADGLGLIGNAVMAKGKEVIEDKLGVKIEDAMQTEEGRQKLLQLQNQHEEFLINAALENRKVDLDFYKADSLDRAGARDMNTRINESAEASWLSKNVAAIIALIVVVGGGLGIIYSPDADVRLGLTSIVTLVLGYYFGTSSSSRGKDTTNAALAEALHRGSAK